jgi:hypothetical protein
MPQLGAKALRITYSTLGFGLHQLGGGFGRPLFILLHGPIVSHAPNRPDVANFYFDCQLTLK